MATKRKADDSPQRDPKKEKSSEDEGDKKLTNQGEMAPLGDKANSESEKQENPIESRRKSTERCIQALVHAFQCRDANRCRLYSCQKMKRVVQHTMICTARKSNGGCPMCKQMFALCCYHAKRCNENNCMVPFRCQQLKNKILQLEQQRLHQAQMLRRGNMKGA